MKVLMTGGTGLIGKALCAALSERGAEIYCLSRNPNQATATNVCLIGWSGATVPNSIPDDINIFINLAGESIAERRWTSKQKERLVDSRVQTTRLLVDFLMKQKSPPKLILSASATGYYGDNRDEIVDEKSPSGVGFLANTALKWEAAAQKAESYGACVTLLRFGVVLSPLGGALKKMLKPFSLGLGGKIGRGDQYMSWITLEDAVRAILFLIEHPTNGPVNICSPHAISNSDFTKKLAAKLGKPAMLPLPACMVRLFFGEMGEALLLASSRVDADVLSALGFTWLYPTIDDLPLKR